MVLTLAAISVRRRGKYISIDTNILQNDIGIILTQP